MSKCTTLQIMNGVKSVWGCKISMTNWHYAHLFFFTLIFPGEMVFKFLIYCRHFFRPCGLKRHEKSERK